MGPSLHSHVAEQCGFERDLDVGPSLWRAHKPGSRNLDIMHVYTDDVTRAAPAKALRSGWAAFQDHGLDLDGPIPLGRILSTQYALRTLSQHRIGLVCDQRDFSSHIVKTFEQEQTAPEVQSALKRKTAVLLHRSKACLVSSKFKTRSLA